MPVLEELAADYAGQGVAIFAVNVGERQDDYQSFIRSASYKHLIWARDSEGNVVDSYRVRGIPVLYVIDPQGIIRYKHLGYGEGMDETFRSEIDSLLNP